MTTTDPTTVRTAAKVVTRGTGATLVTFLCWSMVVFDGYDLTVYGTVVPSLKTEWTITASTLGWLGSLPLIGMLIGAIVAGTLADHIGRRWAILSAAIWFTIWTAAAGLATGPTMFGTFRFLCGLGLGGLIPTASALANEYADARIRPLITTLMLSGIPIGGIITASTAIPIIPHWGWRPMFYFALLGGLLVIPLSMVFLPESISWLKARGQTEKAAAVSKRLGLPDTPAPDQQGAHRKGIIFQILKPPYLSNTILFALAILAVYFAWFGLGSWLPQLMRQQKYELGTALVFTVVLYAGAVLGSLLTGYLGTRVGDLQVGVFAAIIGAIGLGSLLLHPGQFMIYVALVMAGIGTHGVQCLIIAAVASRFPDLLRGSALGLILGVGRVGAIMAPLVGGWLQDAAGKDQVQLGVNYNFIAFGIGPFVSAVMMILLLVVRPKPTATTNVSAE